MTWWIQEWNRLNTKILFLFKEQESPGATVLHLNIKKSIRLHLLVLIDNTRMLYPMAICWDARYQCPETLKRFFSFHKHGTSIIEEHNLRKTVSLWISLQGECWLQEEKLFMGDIHEMENSVGTSFWNGGKPSESTVLLLLTQKIWTLWNTEWAHNLVSKSLQGRGNQQHAAFTPGIYM